MSHEARRSDDGLAESESANDLPCWLTTRCTRTIHRSILIGGLDPVPSSATRPGFRLVAKTADLTAAIDASILCPGATTSSDASISALRNDSAVTDVSTVLSNVEIDVMGDSERAGPGTNRVRDGDAVGARPDRQSVAELHAILGRALGFGVGEVAVGFRTSSDALLANVDPGVGVLGGSGRNEDERQAEGGDGSNGGEVDLEAHGSALVVGGWRRPVSAASPTPARCRSKTLNRFRTFSEAASQEPPGREAVGPSAPRHGDRQLRKTGPFSRD